MWMMLFYFEFANIIWVVLAKLFQTVSGLLNGFVAIYCYFSVIERVHTAYVFVVQCSSIVTTELFKFIRYTAVDAVITNIIW